MVCKGFKAYICNRERGANAFMKCNCEIGTTKTYYCPGSLFKTIMEG